MAVYRETKPRTNVFKCGSLKSFFLWKTKFKMAAAEVEYTLSGSLELTVYIISFILFN